LKTQSSRTSSIRRDVLREWRGCDEVGDLRDRVNSAADLVDSVLGSLGIRDGLQEDEVRSAWKELAGEFIARHSEPLSVKQGHLVLRVTQPAMRFHLEQMKPMLLGRIRKQLGEGRVRSVRFTLG
jgi:predicted nucleic acid-binding Zn ribbon protein